MTIFACAFLVVVLLIIMFASWHAVLLCEDRWPLVIIIGFFDLCVIGVVVMTIVELLMGGL